MKDFKLYVIIDGGSANGRDLVKVASEAVDGGADIIQLREKDLPARQIIETGRAIKAAISGSGALFIINDRADIAVAAGADGLHIGQDDLPAEAARAVIGKGRILGISTHSLAQARDAQRSGADYIGVGPVFGTPTKPDYKPVGLGLIGEVSAAVKIPFVAIGGIDTGNIAQVIGAGAKRIAVVRAVCGAQDVREAARRLKERLGSL